MSEMKSGVQAYYFGRWLAAYIGTIPQYRSCIVHFGPGIISCSLDSALNEPSSVVYGYKMDGQITVDCLVTNDAAEILLWVKLETGGLGKRQIKDGLKIISNCYRYEVRKPDRVQSYFPTPKTRYIIAGSRSSLPGAGIYAITEESLVDYGLGEDRIRDMLNNINIITATDGCVLGRLKRVIANLIPRQGRIQGHKNHQAIFLPLL